MKVSGANPRVRDIAQHLIAYESAGKHHSETSIPAAFQVCEKLRRPLSTLTGTAGFRSLLVRALTLAKREEQLLGTVEVTDDGYLEGLSGSATELEESLLVAQLLGLLMTFIGDALTMRLLAEIWPDLLGIDLNSGEGEMHD
jgi:hypothetical protein